MPTTSDTAFTPSHRGGAGPPLVCLHGFTDTWADVLDFFEERQHAVVQAAPQAEAIMATELGRRRAGEYIATNWDRIPPELLAHQLRGAAVCADAQAMIEQGRRDGWPVDLDRIACPLRFVWGTED